MAIDLDRPPPPPAAGDDTRSAPPVPPTARKALRPLLIRLHFLSGFLVAPIILSLALTGILFAWNYQIDQVRFGDTLSASDPGAAPRPLSDQVQAALDAYPDYTVTEVTPASPDAPLGVETTGVAMKLPEGAEGFGHAPGEISVYVDPSTGEVTGDINEATRSGEWLRNLHSSFQLGTSTFPLMELAASWLVVSILTGLYLYWPKLRRSLRKALTPQLRAPGYRRANALHTVLGMWLIAPLMILIVTGLTWTDFAGSRIDDLRATISSPTPRVETTLPGAAPAEVGAASGAAEGTADFPVNEVTVEQIDTVAAGVAETGVTGLIGYTPPEGPGTAWEVRKSDSQWPLDPVRLAVDGDNGEVVDRVNWSDRPLMSKLTSIGISFHAAKLFGIWTSIYLTGLAALLIVMIVAGYRMWWLRRRPGTWGVPPRVGPLLRTVPVPLMIVGAVLVYLMPWLGISLVIYLVIERAVRAVRARRPLAAADRPEQIDPQQIDPQQEVAWRA